MSLPRLNLVAALARNRVIGIDNRLPWHLPEDLAHFKALTLGHPVLMGRKTFESLARPLPGRRNLVVTRNPAYSAAGIEIAPDIDAALALCADAADVFCIGGAQLYAQCLPRADRLFLTEVQIDATGDARFPEVDPTRFREIARTSRIGETGDRLRFDLVRYERTTGE